MWLNYFSTQFPLIKLCTLGIPYNSESALWALNDVSLMFLKEMIQEALVLQYWIISKSISLIIIGIIINIFLI